MKYHLWLKKQCPRRALTVEQIRAGIRKLVEDGKIRKRMACGREGDVYASVDEKELCTVESCAF